MCCSAPAGSRAGLPRRRCRASSLGRRWQCGIVDLVAWNLPRCISRLHRRPCCLEPLPLHFSAPCRHTHNVWRARNSFQCSCMLIKKDRALAIIGLILLHFPLISFFHGFRSRLSSTTCCRTVRLRGALTFWLSMIGGPPRGSLWLATKLFMYVCSPPLLREREREKFVNTDELLQSRGQDIQFSAAFRRGASPLRERRAG